MTEVILKVIFFSIAGAVLSGFLACIPGLHIYSVLAVFAAGACSPGADLPPEITVPFAAGLITAYAMVNSIPSIILAAPEESAIFTVLPGQKYFMEGRGYEAVLLTAAGGAAALAGILSVCAVAGMRFLPAVRNVFTPHQHWVIWSVIAFMLMSEWPRGGNMGASGWRRFAKAWFPLGMGLFTFVLSGFLGFILFFRSPIAPENAFQNLMPAFTGLFAVPWLALNVMSRMQAPEQLLTARLPPFRGVLARGSLAGLLGGGFAAFFPVVTGGVGGLLAGHAVNVRDNRTFLVSQGASKLVYYAGGVLLFMTPQVHLTRGGGAWLIRSLHLPTARYDFYMGLAAVAIAGAVSIVMIPFLTRLVIRLVRKAGYPLISGSALALIPVMVLALAGWQGLGVMVVSSALGMVPVLFGSRRINCLGIILLPMACSMSGFGADAAAWLGLI
ncbi:MAG: tripartite tricarboxylate transporter permease [Kiritimatiellia bacterium]